jgi:hypothetical protein
MTDSQEGRDDPARENEDAHDVLAAEEFAIPAEEPGIPHDRSPEAHDVLAAEEFAMPAGGDVPGGRRGHGPRLALAGIVAGIAALAFRRWRRR